MRSSEVAIITDFPFPVGYYEVTYLNFDNGQDKPGDTRAIRETHNLITQGRYVVYPYYPDQKWGTSKRPIPTRPPDEKVSYAIRREMDGELHRAEGDAQPEFKDSTEPPESRRRIVPTKMPQNERFWTTHPLSGGGASSLPPIYGGMDAGQMRPRTHTHTHLAAPYRVILQCYRRDTPCCATLFQGGWQLPKNGAVPLPLVLSFTRHICAIPHFATHCAIIVRYPTKQASIGVAKAVFLANGVLLE